MKYAHLEIVWKCTRFDRIYFLDLDNQTFMPKSKNPLPSYENDYNLWHMIMI